MENYSTIFKQLLHLLPQRTFSYEAEKYGYNKYVKHFTVWSQLVTNLYAQVRGKESLREIESCLLSQHSQLYHLGLRNVSKSQLAYANRNRSYEIFKNLFYSLADKCHNQIQQGKFKFKNPLYLLDSTLIALSLSLFPWARYRKAKGALKIHMLLNQRTSIPSFIDFSEGRKHDMKMAEAMTQDLLPGSIITMDKAYIKFRWLYELHKKGIFFVVRAKDNMDYDIVGQHKKIPDKSGVMDDKWVMLRGDKSKKDYPERMRMIWYWDEEKNEEYIFLTNNKKLSPSTIAEIYKARWDIETFFKWIKQNLKIKHFLGNNENAVMTQVWTAMIYYLLLKYIAFQTRTTFSLLKLAWILGETAMKRLDIIDVLSLSRNKFKSGQDPGIQRILINI